MTALTVFSIQTLQLQATGPARLVAQAVQGALVVLEQQASTRPMLIWSGTTAVGVPMEALGLQGIQELQALLALPEHLERPELADQEEKEGLLFLFSQRRSLELELYSARASLEWQEHLQLTEVLVLLVQTEQQVQLGQLGKPATFRGRLRLLHM